MKHSSLQDLSEIVVSAWVLGASDKLIPTSHGLLDRALKIAVDNGAFGEWGKMLHFVDSRVGLQCVELRGMLDWAQRLQLTTAPNPTYSTTQVQITEGAARSVLREHEIDADVGEHWGRLLEEAISESLRILEDFGQPAIEVA